MRFSDARGRVLHWRSDGRDSARPIVFVNALGTDLRSWDRVADLLEGEYRLLRYDKRGHGLSELGPGAVSIDAHVDDLVALLDHAGVESCDVVGLSVGGMIAQRFAVRHPERVWALVLCDTAARIGSDAMWNARIEAIEAGGLEDVADAVMDRWFLRAWKEANPIELRGWRTMMSRTSVAGYVATCAAIRDADLTAQAASIRAPCLCVVGDGDGSTPPDLVRHTASLIPGATFEVIADSGHLPCIDQPRRLAALIRAHTKQAVHGDAHG